MKQQLLISFSGGRTSAFMTWWLMTYCKDKYEMIIVFANTGKEREETLVFVDQCAKHWGWHVTWIEAITNPERGKGVAPRIVDFATASRNGEPFEAMIKKHGIPNISAPRCSRELKAYVIRAYARSIGWKGYYTAIGIRSDELRRLNWETAKKNRILYPLASLYRVTKTDINRFWLSQPFDLQLKSYEGNCDLCWKKSMRKLMTLVSEHPEMAAWWKQMELLYGNHIPQSQSKNPNLKPPVRFFIQNQSIDDIVQAARNPFEPAIDDSKLTGNMTSPIYDEELDEQAFRCAESCEAF